MKDINTSEIIEIVKDTVEEVVVHIDQVELYSDESFVLITSNGIVHVKNKDILVDLKSMKTKEALLVETTTRNTFCN